MKWIASLIIALSACLHAEQVINLFDLDNINIQEFSQGKLNDYILEIPEGVTLPFKMTVKGDFLAVDSISELKILKTCFIRCQGEAEYLFSSDMQTWKEFSEFFTGQLSVSVEVQDEMPVAGLELQLNQR